MDVEIHVIDTLWVCQIVSITVLLHACDNVFANGVMNLFRSRVRTGWIVFCALRDAASQLFRCRVLGASRQRRDQCGAGQYPARDATLEQRCYPFGQIGSVTSTPKGF
jgi:hypothetical protein